MNAAITADVKNGLYHGFVTYWGSLSGKQTAFISSNEADISNYSPTSLLTYHQGFQKSNFLPKPTPDEVFYANQVDKSFPTWAFNVGLSSSNSMKISDVVLHYKSPNFFAKLSLANNQINFSTGLELWRGGRIANGFIVWRISPDIYSSISSERFWKDINDIQHWSQILRITNPGARFIEIVDHNGKLLHTVDLLQSPPGRPAFIKGNFEGNNGFENNRNDSKRYHIDPDEYGSFVPSTVDMTDDYLVVSDHDDDNDSNPNSHPSNQKTLYQTQSFLHEHVIKDEAIRRKELEEHPQISLFEPMLDFIQKSIQKLDISRYTDDEMKEYLHQLHQLSLSLPISIQQDVKYSYVYKQLYSLLQAFPIDIPALSTPTAPLYEAQNDCDDDDDDDDHDDDGNNDTNNTEFEFVEYDSPPNSVANCHQNQSTDHNTSLTPSLTKKPSLIQIPNNGDPFDMSNITDQQILSLPRSDTPYTFLTDPYYISGHTILLTTARLLQLPSLFKHINVYANFHYTFLHDATIKPYRSHYRLLKAANQVNPKDNLKGEHLASLSAHVHTTNDRFHLLCVSSPTHDVYSARLAFTLNDENNHRDSYSPDHPLSPQYTPWVKHPAQKLLIPDVYYLDDDEKSYLRHACLPSAQHVFGCQAILYPSSLPRGWRPGQHKSTQTDPDGKLYDKPSLEEFMGKNTPGVGLSSKISPMALLGHFHKPFQRWYSTKNIQFGIEFQYAYIRPIKLNFWETTESIAQSLDNSLDWVSLTKHAIFDQNSTHNTDTQLLTYEQPLSMTSGIGIDPEHIYTAPLPPPPPSTIFKDSLHSIRIHGLDKYNQMMNYLPYFLTRNPTPSQPPTTAQPTPEQLPPQVIEGVDTPISAPPQSATANSPSTSDPHAISLATLYKLRKPPSYQQTMVTGVNLNTNGIIQGYTTIDINTTTTLSACLQIDVSAPPTGRIGPIAPHSGVKFGLGVSYTSR